MYFILLYGCGCFTANKNTRIFHISTNEDNKKYIMREKRVCFPAGFVYSLFACFDF